MSSIIAQSMDSSREVFKVGEESTAHPRQQCFILGCSREFSFHSKETQTGCEIGI
jgi:hypothetical protein